MSFKYRAQKIAEGHWVLEAGCNVPVHAFLSDELYRDSEENVWAQMVTAANLPGVKRVAVTPDMHVGYSVPIGVVIETEGTLLPTAAGYDIGCGMVQLRTDVDAGAAQDPARRRTWIDAVTDRIGVGVGAKPARRQRRLSAAVVAEVLRHGAPALGRQNDRTERSGIPVEDDADVPERAAAKTGQLGSLGGGNHFCEMQVGDDGRVWVMIHTGSRGFGWTVADGFFREGADALGLKKGERDLVWFARDSKLGRRYWALHNMAANFAIANRVLIADAVKEALDDVFGGTTELFYEISHNLIQCEGRAGTFVHRKGATRAFPAGHALLRGTRWAETGHPILIPGSMATGSAILFALPVAAAACWPVNHGAGRRLARGEARRRLDQAEVDRAMKAADILLNTRNAPIDESGACYKDLEQVLAAVEQAGLARVEHRLRPVACIKGAD